MSVSQIFYISVYALACLSGGMLAGAEGRFFPVGLTVPIGIAAWYLNEQSHRVRLSARWANVLALVAFIYPLFEFFGENLEGRLLAGAHLLVLLQWIILLQDKNAGQYWWIFTLSILQVAVAAVLTTEGWFGALLVLYLLAGIWTLSLFSLFQGEKQFKLAELYAEQNLSAAARLPLRGAPALAAGTAGTAAARVWASMARSSIQQSRNDTWVNARFVGGVVGMTTGSLMIGICFFLLVPRVWLAGVDDTDHETGSVRTMSGFTPKVRLGDMGQILESTQSVFRTKFIDNDTNTPVDVAEYALEFGMDEPLFAGAALVFYTQGVWKPTITEIRRIVVEGPKPVGSIRQEYVLEAIGTKNLFVMWPFFERNSGKIEQPHGARVYLQGATGVLTQDLASASSTIRYFINSPRHRAGLNPSRMSPGTGISEALMGELRQFPETELPRLAELARNVANAEQLPANDPAERALQKAQALEAYLRDSGEFSYSLDGSIIDPNLDPVEDFLFNRKKGHCEYYATALALMLRAIGIPACLVSGFKGGELNSSGEFEVQQRHAHAWVQAFVNGEWRVFDATPVAGREAAVAEVEHEMQWIVLFRFYIFDFWQRYVINMSLARQIEDFYEPLKQAGAALLAALHVRSIGQTLLGWLKKLTTHPERWFSWRGGVLAFLFMLLASLAMLAGRFLLRIVRGAAFGGHRRRAVERARVDFDTFIRVMAAHGLAPEPAQTDREFSEEVAARLEAPLAAVGLGALPGEFSEAFYRVRFGSESLAESERDRLLARLKLLESTLRQRPLAH